MSERSSPNQLPKTCPWVLRVGVFFDGTGNNKKNDGPVGEMSNIAKLFETYLEKDDEKKLRKYKRIYKNGVGTIDDEDNELGGIVKGEGGIERIHEAIKQVSEFFDETPCAKEFIVDVFGFSRGAAQARHFVNELHDRAAGPNVKVGFVGLFDTVASFAGSWWGILGLQEDQAGDNINVAEWKVEKGTRTVKRRGQEYEVPYYESFVQPFNFHLSAASADQVEHFVAKDEVRKNFPLSSIEPNDGGFLNEETFIGVHSDIGGGYGPEDDYENKLEWVARYRNRHPGSRGLADRRRRRNIGDYEREERFTQEEVDQIKQKYLAQGYDIEEKEINLKVWLVGRKKVDNELAKVYLKLMYNRATGFDVPFEPLPDDDIYQIPDKKDRKTGETNPKFCETLARYSNAVLTNQEFPKEFEREIYSKHVHQSDVDDEDRASIFSAKQYGTDLGNEPDENHIRRIFPNDSNLAVVPEANDNSNAEGAEINTENLAEREDGENT
ncbi:T6SS phospholipase effector Tle1-like catalytic domain-containing protein [Kangiella shandongensis]|uniref:T6SS phospholipase effector Tle1-like catalytic domain-containing protein n=1 Tax=Kangiella shandongensis TaxID=2763258 RepID=UPI001CC12E6E|nr:DUF2235 domain-containing protein [Kangiella shandongensis]